jgi:hypothetical protein
MHTLTLKVINHLKWRIVYTKMKTYLFFKIGIYDMFISPFLKKRVTVGIFEGMTYNNTSIGSVLLPKLYGTYEVEVQEFIKQLDLNSYDVFVDIGCADGYYLAGIGMISDIPKVIGYDGNKYAKKQCNKIICDNKLLKERFEIKGFFNEKEFYNIIEKYRTPLFLIDVDGYEKELFKNIPASSFSHATFLIETHEFIVPGIVEELFNYFKKTHSIEKLDSTNGANNIKYVNRFGPSVRRKIVSEHRPGNQSFLKITPKSSFPAVVK